MDAFATTRMSSKGQVVIPESIRRKLGLQEGTRFLVVAEGDVVVLKAVAVPALASFQSLIRRARDQAVALGLTERDVAEAIKDVRDHENRD